MQIKTNLVEFGDNLRGILVLPKNPQKIVIMSGGFERSATTEKKFKFLTDKLAERNIASFRFDYNGIGLSDGDFSQITVAMLTKNLRQAISIIKKEINFNEKVSVIGHSLFACPIAKLSETMHFDKIILLSPALNQSNLLRYWFTKSMMKNKNIEINWKNFTEYLDEEKFKNDCERKDKITKSHFVSSKYFLENMNKNYCSCFADKNMEKIIHIHGDNDNDVPIESLTCSFPNQIIVKNGDHDLEKPAMFKQWVDQVVKFL